ncbi:MAG TPA: PEP/pyruvate-binding domain-containing protein [Acidimicrobiales bacterium]|nr:PEP/pyruvate-binding domain-containing protein [Acidimicrobiales bacterium]
MRVASEAELAFLDAADPDVARAEAVGAKAANLMRMARAGLPVPPGFVLGTKLCVAYHEAGEGLRSEVITLIERGVRHVEAATGLRFGASRHPLLVAVRSGAARSMPGMLDTILNVGLCDLTVSGLLRATGDPVFVWDSYRRLIASHAEVVAGCPSSLFDEAHAAALEREGVPTVAELDVAALRWLVDEMKSIYLSTTGGPFPQDPMQQLRESVEAVFRSWNSDRAVTYRKLEGLSDLVGTAVTVQAMVFGNQGVTSGSGVGFTRDPATGENRLYVDFLLNAQGDDVVGGRQVTGDPEPLIAAVPGLAHQLQHVRRTLESLFGDAQDFEFTVEDGKLWVLQSRTAKRTDWAALQITCDLVDEGILDETAAIDRVAELDVEHIVRLRLDTTGAPDPIGQGTAASAGVAAGVIALDAVTARARAEGGETVILVRDEASTDDIDAFSVCAGLLTARGARTSHAAVVARQRGMACVVNCADLTIDVHSRRAALGSRQLQEGDAITLDGAEGAVYPGILELVEERPTELVKRVRAWRHDESEAGR